MAAAKYNFEEAINTFFIESKELLNDMENGLLDLEKDVSSREPIPAIFRAMHTIKGSAGMFGFADIGDFSHVVEDMLDDIRNDVIPVVPDMIGLLLNCRDHILKMLNFFDANRTGKIDAALKNESAGLINQLNAYMFKTEKKNSENVKDIDKEESLSDIKVINECWHISLRFSKNVFKNGLDPQSFISYLGQMGKIVKIKTITDLIPSMDEMDPEFCYLGFEISFMGYTSKEKIEEVFEFIREDCKIRILPPGSNLAEYVKLIEELSEKPRYLGEILIEIGSLTKKELEEALKLQETLAKEKNIKRIGEVVIDEQMVSKPVVEAAVNKQATIKKAEENIKKSMRIDTSKLDDLVNLVGELVISAANVGQVVNNIGDSALNKTFSQMSRLISEVREKFMNIRMVQIGESFKRFERIVRDISIEKGKKVDLILNGGETELDKTIIEKVNDPLMHLVRNAVDHGIDLPEERILKGKPDVGRVILNAYQEAGNVVIEIKDDGNGLNKEKILSKALQKGMITPEKVPLITDNDLFNFIFSPGFSTADKVTDISGRGVGMDVVKKNIESLRGFVTLQSKEGKGTSVRIYLPLTLAIIDGFLIKAGALFCVLPLAMVSECANISKSKKELITYENGDFINLRGEIVPFIRIRDFFNEQGDIPEMENIVVVNYADKKVGFVVDEALGEFQTVVKPLGRIFKKVEWISGATILVGGEVGLILDVPKLVQYLQAIEVKKAS
ncbi:MAG: chemotaxis protein CheA [Spirochaetes bacterium]|nr:chemotaxis protein CheA [Spirochaetota bacterium]